MGSLYYRAQVYLNNSASADPNARKYSGGRRIYGVDDSASVAADALTQADLEACGLDNVNISFNQGPAASFEQTGDIGLEFTATQYGAALRR